MKYMWVVNVDEKKAKEQGITPADVTIAIESLGDDILEVLAVVQEDEEEKK